MGKYLPEEHMFGVSLDEIGIDLGLQRLPEESLNNYRRRLTLNAKKPPNSKKASILETPQRRVGLFEKRMFEIDLVRDSEGKPTASDPRIEVDSSYFYVWKNWNYGKSEPDLKVNISLRSEKYFMRDLYNALSKLDFVTVVKTLEYDDFLKSFNLKICNSDRLFENDFLRNSKFNNLNVENIRSIAFSNNKFFFNEVRSIDEIINPGDYYLDYVKGRLYSESEARGSAVGSYSAFPFNIMWQPVKVFEAKESSLKEKTRDLLINDDGNLERLLLNPYGAKIANTILAEHPLQWGK